MYNITHISFEFKSWINLLIRLWNTMYEYIYIHYKYQNLLWNKVSCYMWWKIPGFIPTDLSKTIVYVLNFFILTKWKLINKWPLPWYDHSLYTGQRRYILLLYYCEFLEMGTGTCKASASSMLREGDWNHIQDMTFPTKGVP